MKLLLDTHFVLAFVDKKLEERFPQFANLLVSEDAELSVSVASIWEIAIKTRLKKLDPRIDPSDMPSYLAHIGIEILGMTVAHATAEVQPEPLTRDPFDRLLLAQAQIEGMRFVTVDRALADHPVTFR
ncbi:MAG: type II toxin-antitoxin system VapC family toxin [Beijerinckiaceae bacterium]